MLKWIVAAIILWWFLRSKGALRNLGLPSFIGDIPAGSPGYVPPTNTGCSDCGPITMGTGMAPAPYPMPGPAIQAPGGPVSQIRVASETFSPTTTGVPMSKVPSTGWVATAPGTNYKAGVTVPVTSLKGLTYSQLFSLRRA